MIGRLLLGALFALGARSSYNTLKGVIQKAGYASELHDVTTEDGWRLSMIRIY